MRRSDLLVTPFSYLQFSDVFAADASGWLTFVLILRPLPFAGPAELFHRECFVGALCHGLTNMLSDGTDAAWLPLDIFQQGN